MIKIGKKECKESKRVEKELSKGNSETELYITFGKFPMDKWNEWWSDCQKNFNTCRWFKAWSDHLRAKNSVENAVLWKRIEELESKLDTLLSQPEEEKKEDKEEIKNLHGEVIA